MNIEIIHEPTADKPFLVIYKPKGLPSAPLTEEDSQNALTQAIEKYPEIKSVCGKKPIEYGLLHRLDTATDGLMVIAATQECYDFLITEQAEGRFIKTYTAECDIIKDNAEKLGGFPVEVPELTGFPEVTSYFRPYGEGRKEVRPVTENSGKAALAKLGKKKLYTTKIEIKKLSDTRAQATCEITEGYRHQVRCHLAWSGYPVIGDQLYNSECKSSDLHHESSDLRHAELVSASDLLELKFSATKIAFEYPKDKINTFTCHA